MNWYCCHFTFPRAACHPGFLIIFRNNRFEKWRGASSSQMYCCFSCAPDYLILCSTVSQFSCSVVSDCLQPQGLQHTGPPCPSPTPRIYSNSCPLSRWCIQPAHPLLSPSPAFNLSQHQGVFKWVSSSHQVARVLEFQLQHQSFQWMFRTDFL